MTSTPPAHGAAADRRVNGFTLLELLVVLAILGLLAAIVGPQVVRYLGTSRTEAAHVQSRNIAASLQLYRLDMGGFPTAEEGLKALVQAPAGHPEWNGPYIAESAALNDPWGHPYQFKVPGEHGEVDVFSLGSDNAVGGTGEAKDVGNW